MSTKLIVGHVETIDLETDSRVTSPQRNGTMSSSAASSASVSATTSPKAAISIANGDASNSAHVDASMAVAGATAHESVAAVPVAVGPVVAPTFPLMMPSGFFDLSALGSADRAGKIHSFPQYAPLPPFYGALKSPFAFPLSSSSSRRVVNSAEKRANHNAIERARRDSLNNRFQEIADCIPQLKDLKKPSKSVIMQKTLEYVRVSQARFDIQQAEIERLRKENERLKAELATYRGLPATPATQTFGRPTAHVDDVTDFDLANVKIDMSAVRELSMDPSMGDPRMFSMDGQQSADGVAIKLERSIGEAPDPFDDIMDDDYMDDLPLSEMSDTFDFDLVKERIEMGLSGRHDKDWLLSHGIMKDVVPIAAPLQAMSQRMEFKIKQRSLNQQLSSRPSVEDLIGMHIMEQ